MAKKVAKNEALLFLIFPWPKKLQKNIHGPEKSMALFDFALLVASFCRVQVCGIHQARLGGLPCSWPFPVSHWAGFISMGKSEHPTDEGPG